MSESKSNNDAPSHQSIIVTVDGSLGIVQLNRPGALNILTSDLLTELVGALESLDNDPNINVIILTGGEKVFSAGADLKQRAKATRASLIHDRILEPLDQIRRISKPIIAAVSGYCLGGGNELAMNCDIILASETANFGQPEVKVGIMPGGGGTQRLPRAVGKYKAMEMILTGKSISAQEANRCGLVNLVVPVERLMDEAKKMAHEIASNPPISIRAAKSSVLAALGSPLEVGLEYERKTYYSLYDTEDAREGMNAFLEKRKPRFKGK